MNLLRTLTCLSFLALPFAGCHRNDDDQIRTVSVPKEEAAPPATEPAQTPDLPAGHPSIDQPAIAAVGPVPAPTDFTYTAPADWKLEGAKSMRVASFIAGPTPGKTAEVIITRLPTGAGDWLDNINRWRNQVALPPVDTADPATGADIQVGSNRGRLYDFQGPAGKRQIVVVVNKAGSDWFLKITGPSETVSSQQQPFFDFLKSVHLGD